MERPRLKPGVAMGARHQKTKNLHTVHLVEVGSDCVVDHGLSGGVAGALEMFGGLIGV